jgi:hypothetical protein
MQPKDVMEAYDQSVGSNSKMWEKQLKEAEEATERCARNN